MITEKTPSKYQIEIEKVYINTNSNILIEAGPGSGKSHTILQLLKITPQFKKCILVAFNKSIQQELESKVPANTKVSTIHSLGYSILRKNVSANFKLNNFKNFIIAKKNLDLSRMKEKSKDSYLFTISHIIDLSRMNLVEKKEDIEKLCDQYNISTVNGEVNDVLSVLLALNKYNKKKSGEFMIDFTDMLYLAYKMVSKEDYPKYNIVFCDELQDLNPLQKEIVENVIHPKIGRFVGVGDSRQSIYSFMGANLDSFNSFKLKPNTVTLPLSVTYRCSKSVTEKANEIFPGLECFEGNIQGEVRVGNIVEVEEGDFIICRNNMPLIMAWIEVVKNGKKAHILGKDFGQNLLTIISKLHNYPDHNTGTEDLLNKKEKELKEKGISKPKSNQNYLSLVEKLTIIDILVKHFGTLSNTEKKVEEIFNDDEKSGVILMTGHKSKGLQTDRVFFLDRDLIPSKYAETPTEFYQEKCLEYVITTRAKQDLIYI